MKTRLWLMAMLALSAATLTACGDDEDTAPANNEDGGGTGGTAGDDETDAGGTGGGGGTSGAGAGGTGGGAPVAMPVQCGETLCQPPENPLGAFAGALGPMAMLPATGFACCLNAAAGECGFSMTEDGETCNEPAVPDTRCEDFEIPIELPFPLPPLAVGCCIENQCGVDGRLFGNGCTENDDARDMLGAQPMIGMFLVGGVPPAHACDMPLPTDAGPDASDEDAGN